MIKPLILALVLCTALSAPSYDKMTTIPGYPSDFKTAVYSGYLDLNNVNRSAHYVFVQSANDTGNTLPLTLWLNGGPGCSSLLGFIQQIGPYFLEEGVNYKEGDNLTENKYSWHKVSNLLFLQSPAGVGFSYNLDKDFQYDDAQTANDNYRALLSFYQKFPEYSTRGLWLAGQSYAGKYIPDLAQLITQSNQQKKTTIKLKGVMIGNGIISFNHLHHSSIEYMLDRHFVDPQTIQYWKSSCQTDPHSAGCRFFEQRFIEDTNQLNPYNVYGYCYYNDSFDSNKTKKYESQGSILQKIKQQFNEKAQQAGSSQNVRDLIYSNKEEKVVQQQLIKINQNGSSGKFNGAPCAYFDGMANYFNAHAALYKAKFPDMRWNGPCASNITYHINPQGSMQSMRFLLSRETNRSQIVLYNGNWDVVVPYIDTVKNIKDLNLKQAYIYSPWFVGNQHAGFSQLYSGLLFITVKGASHQVPQAKRQVSLQLFNDTISGHPQFQRLPEETKSKFVTD